MSQDQKVAVETVIAEVPGVAEELTADVVRGGGWAILDVRQVTKDGVDIIRVTIPHMLGFRKSVFEVRVDQWPFILRSVGS